MQQQKVVITMKRTLYIFFLDKIEVNEGITLEQQRPTIRICRRFGQTS